MAGATRTTTHHTARTRSWWGWGWADAHPDDAECTAMGALLPGTLARPLPVPRISDLRIDRPAVEAPRSLSGAVTADPRRGPRTRWGRPTATWSAPCTAAPAASPTSSPTPRATVRWPTCWSGPANTASRSSRSAAALPCRAVWSTGATGTGPCCPWT